VIAVGAAIIAAQLVTFLVMTLRRLPWIVKFVSRTVLRDRVTLAAQLVARLTAIIRVLPGAGPPCCFRRPALSMPIDELVGAPHSGDPRIHSARCVRRTG
jgi:hypothetical protein